MDTESFGTTFGPKSQRKKPRLGVTDIDVRMPAKIVLIIVTCLYIHLQSLVKSVEECAGTYVCAHMYICMYAPY